MDNEKKNYDYTGRERVDRQRKALSESGGARVEALFDSEDLARLDAIVESGKASSRSGALRYAVRKLPAPKIKG